MNLAALQNEFAKALHYQSSGEACNIISDAFTADERMQIYRNNFIVGLSEILQITYPTVQALLGEECFLQLARQHVLDNPLNQGDVSEYGEHFDQTLLHFDAVMQAAPYCAEVARFEWTLDISQQRHANVESLSLRPLAQLSALSPEQHAHICFHLSPAALPFSSQYALFSLHHAVQKNEIEGLDINLAEQGVIVTTNTGLAKGLALTNPEFLLIQQLYKSIPLADIEPSLLSSLNTIIELGVIAGFSLTSPIDNSTEQNH